MNFNQTDEENRRTLAEIRRMLRNNKFACALLTVVVDRRYDGPTFGNDQELLSPDLIKLPGVFSSFKTKEDGSIELIPGTGRKCWPVKYYESLFEEFGFKFIKFDLEAGKTYFPEESGMSYRRYLLTRKTSE